MPSTIKTLNTQAAISHDAYPDAIWYPIPPTPTPKFQTTVHDKNQIVDHITEGTTVMGALSWYANLSNKPYRYGAHFYIDRDGTVYQTALIGATTWHASQVNIHAIGIEHVASSGTGTVPFLPVTDAQYTASAKLHVWLAKQINITLDRAHVRSHNEASPADGHVFCCIPTLDLDKLVAMAGDMLKISSQTPTVT